MTWADIRSAFWEIHGGDADLYPEVDAMLLPFANMAQRRIADDTNAIVSRSVMFAVAGQQEYTLPDDYRDMIRISFDGDKLRKTSKFELQIMRPDGWDHITGTPRWYYLDGANHAVGLYEIPNTSTVTEADESGFGIVVGASGTGGVVLDTSIGVKYDPQEFGMQVYSVGGYSIEAMYYAVPDDMNEDSDSPSLPAWAHPYVLFDLLRAVYSSGARSRDPEKAAFWGQMARDGIMRLKGRAGASKPVRYEFRESDDAPSGTWSSRYPKHIEES